MPSYKVMLHNTAATRSVTDPVTETVLNITADDVSMGWAEADTGPSMFAWFNFNKGDSDDPITVAAIPYDQVRYITS